MAKRKTWAQRRETYQRNHGGLTPYQVQKARYASVGTTPYQVKKARAERKLGPVRRETARILDRTNAVLTIDQMREANERWGMPAGLQRYEHGADARRFSPWQQSVQSSQGFGVLANQYNTELGRINPAYVLAFYNAIVRPGTGYGAMRDEHGAPFFDSRGLRKATREWADYVHTFGEVISGQDQEMIDLWFDHRYSMVFI